MSQGRLRYHVLAGKSFDPFTTSSDPIVQAFIRDHIDLLGTYAPNPGASIVPWMPNTAFYRDLSAIYVDTTEEPNVVSHPEFIAKDINGNKLFLNYGGPPFPQYQADLTSLAYRQYLKDEIIIMLNLSTPRAYGVWLDDVNLTLRTCDTIGNFVSPVDSSTGQVITPVAWASYVSDTVESLRVNLPYTVKVIHNSIWTTPWSSSVRRQIAACDLVLLEHGIGSDPGLTGGNGIYSVASLMRFIDQVHNTGSSVILYEESAVNEYALAGYFLVNNGSDMIGFTEQLPDNTWPSILSADLGYALEGRISLGSGLWRRVFSGGSVYFVEPGGLIQTISLPRKMIDFAGIEYSSIILNAKQGKVLVNLVS